MKKILLALSFVAIIFASCETPTDSAVTVSLSKSSATELGLQSSHKHFMFSVSNNTSEVASIKWKHAAEATNPTGWTYSVNGSTMNSGSLSIPANGSVMITLMVMPNGNAGTGAGMVQFYDSADEAGTKKSFSYNLTTVSSLFNIIEVSSLTGSTRVNNGIYDYKMKVYNPNSSETTVNWRLSNSPQNPSQWAVNICDENECLLPTILDGNFNVAAGDTADFKVQINHFSASGTGGASVNFYNAGDSTNTSVIKSIDHTVNS